MDGLVSRASISRDEQRDEVLARAAVAIAENGYHGMSMRDLAKATGRALASLYHLFTSKEEMLFEIQERAFSELLTSAMAESAASGTPAERLHRFVQNHVEFFVREPAVMRVLVQEASTLPPKRRRAIRDLKQRYFGLGESLLAAVTPRSGARLDAAEMERSTYCFFGMLNWIYGWYEPAQHGSPTELGRTIVDMAVSGVAGRAAMQPRLVAGARKTGERS